MSASEESELFPEEGALLGECRLEVKAAPNGGSGGGAFWRACVRFMAKSAQ